MRIVGVDTLRLGEYPNLLWLHLRTDEGLVGLGETFFGAAAVEAYLHTEAADVLVGRDPGQIEALARDLRPYLGHGGAGTEVRGNSAVDIALWDLLGQATGQPLHQLLGGRSRDRVRLYNTCAGPRYIRAAPRQEVSNWGTASGVHEDLDGFLHSPGALARDLRAQGLTGMKIWPFDVAAQASRGVGISAAGLRAALAPFDAIRDAVGGDVDVFVELHSLWDVPTAIRIARALQPYDPYWLEDPVRADDRDALAAVTAAVPTPVAASETLSGRRSFRDLLQHRAADVVLCDVSWCGGVTEAKAIAVLADSWDRPVGFHDCTGPVVLTASTHLALHAPNVAVQEFVRASYYGWYGDLVTALPPVAEGHIGAPEGPGLGIALQPDLWRRPDATVRSTPDLRI